MNAARITEFLWVHVHVHVIIYIAHTLQITFNLEL